MSKITAKVLVATAIIVALLIGLFVGCDYGSVKTKEYVLTQLEVHEDSSCYYVEIDGERYSYFKD